MMNVPFLDLRAQYDSIKPEIDEAIQQVLCDCAFIKGKYVAQFEEQFAEFLGVSHCVGCGNGTDALEIAVRALGIGPGDEVIVPANTFIASAESVSANGAQVVFCDIHPQTYNIDVSQIEQKITPSTRAILAVHLYGQPAEMDSILEIASRHNLFVIEDTAQAHGARYKGARVGTLGTIATFSFFPGKNLGAYGDAGAIVTNDEDLAVQCRMIANHGRIDKYDHKFEGRNSRLDGLQSAILSVKLRHLDKWSAARRRAASIYTELLSGKGIEPPYVPDWAEPVFHLFVVQVSHREELRSRLQQRGIATGVHYPVALPFLGAYSSLGHRSNDFPVSYRQMSQILSLPIFPEIRQEQIEAVVEGLQEEISELEKAAA